MTSKFKQAISKVSKALFSTFGGQGLLIKKDLSEFPILLMEQDKSFQLKEGFVVDSKDIKIKSDEKPHLGDKVVIEGKELLIKASPICLGNQSYSIKVR